MIVVGPSMSTDEVNQESLQMETRKDDIYKTKKIDFLGQEKQIIVQNENGACPLIAICNVLLLRGDMKLDSPEASLANLVTHVTNTMVKFTTHANSEEKEYVLHAISLLPFLANGINVDMKFTGINEFEPTRELAIFHSLMIPLYHGWVIEDMDFETAAAIGYKSYGALTRETQTVKAAQHELTPEKVEVINKFLTNNRTQLTVTGLSCLQEKLIEGELCVFFRNNHFLTMLKYDNELYQLVTDQMQQQNLVWEKLNKVNGDSVFVTGNFEVFESDKCKRRKMG